MKIYIYEFHKSKRGICWFDLDPSHFNERYIKIHVIWKAGNQTSQISVQFKIFRTVIKIIRVVQAII